MQVVILAAGKGTRMKELTANVPKPMLEINGKPILAYKVESLPDKINEIIFVVGYLGEKIRKYFGDEHAGKKISYVVQDELNGTGGALNLTKNLIKDDFLLMMADDLYVKDDMERLMLHKLAVLGSEVNDPWKFGIIQLDERGNLGDIVEKPNIPGPAFAVVGLYKLNRKVFDYLMTLSERGEYEIIQALSLMAKEHPVRVEKATGWLPIGSPEDLEKAGKEIRKFL